MKASFSIYLLIFLSCLASPKTSGLNQAFKLVKPSSFVFSFNPVNQFLIGAMNGGWDVDYQWIERPLGFNLWHQYGGNYTDATGRHYPFGWMYWSVQDSLFTHIDYYRGGIQNAFLRMNTHNMHALMGRPKVVYLCYGQRSDYQCEYVSPQNDLWFYSFNSNDPAHVHTGTSIQDNSVHGKGVWVKRCLRGSSPAGYVVDRLKANAEQSNPGNGYQNGDNKREWFIKPRIKIDSAFANNPQNQNVPVCRVIVKNQNANTFKDVTLRARNFLVHQNDTYNGDYIEEFKYNPVLDTARLRYYGAWSTIPQYYSSRGEGPEYQAFNHSDIQVYWFGNCNMWIDYVRVDDDVADKLFKGYYEVPGREWLLWEARDIACYLEGNASFRYYIELFEFNNIPCMKYVSRKLDSISYSNCGKHINLLAMPIPFTYSFHVPWKDRLRVQNTNHLIRNFIDSVGEKELFIGFFPFNSSYHWPEPDPYPTWTRIPNTLPRHSGNGVLAQAIEPEQYDRWLQNYLDSFPYSFEAPYSGGIRNPVEEDPGGFRYAMQFGDSVSKKSGIPFLYNPQAHIWFCQCGAGNKEYYGTSPREVTGEVQREPTNEELDMTTNVAITYGVRGMIWFEMLSNNDTDEAFYSRGLMNPWLGNPMPGPPRYTNIYGQQKFDKLIGISQRLKKWEPYVMSFNNAGRHSYIYRINAERNLCLNNSYFKDIISYKRHTGENRSDVERSGLRDTSLQIENNEERYLQAATFNTIPGNYEQFFMIINRRCSPLQASHFDGERFLRVTFDSGSVYFPTYNKWRLINLDSNIQISEFDVKRSSVVDLGWFAPGEGRLYKLTPDTVLSVPVSFRLMQNYPNPFNPSTVIKFVLPGDSKVKLVVYDLLGREIKLLVDEAKTAGNYEIEFNMKNFASGVYFYRMEAIMSGGKTFIDAKKMVLLK